MFIKSEKVNGFKTWNYVKVSRVRPPSLVSLILTLLQKHTAEPHLSRNAIQLRRW